MSIIFIKGMMCVRCKMAVKAVLHELQLHPTNVELGKVEISEELFPETLLALDNGLRYYELELMSDRKKILVERIKIAILVLFEDTHKNLPVRFSEYLSKTLFYNYTHLANLFSELEHSTIERYYIETRLRKAKDLLLSEDLSIYAVAAELGFNSTAHFCLQFKKMTGLTPRNFRKQMSEMEVLTHKSNC